MNIDDKPTENLVASMLMRDRHRRHFCIPRYTPYRWWENDVFMITDSGYWYEFEIKLTIGDFRKDKNKEMTRWGRWDNGKIPKNILNKHDLLANTEEGPLSFYFVAPAGIIPHRDIPAWAGLIEFTVSGKNYYEKVPAIKAPRRHKNKIDNKEQTASLKTCYWRFHDLRE